MSATSKSARSKIRASQSAAGPRRAATPRAKREELTTYRELELGRELKSIRQRRRIEGRGKLRVIGDGTADRPYLSVPAERYRQARLEHQRRLLLEARAQNLPLSSDRLLAQLTPRVEQLTYAQLADEAAQETTRHLPLAALGRALTGTERASFAATRALEKSHSLMSPAVTALDQALGAIERRQSHNPARYQSLWAELVGPDAAAQSQLHRIDPATQTAWIRCHNSVLSADLQRRRALPAQLSKVLGVPVRQLRASF
jgi:hypothetical protein